MKKVYIDGQEIDWQDLIKRAKEYGYEGDNGIFYTSSATKILRDNGHEIEEK